MAADAVARATKDRWCDAEGNHVALFSWVERVAEHPEHGVLFSRPHQWGEVVGRGPDVLYVRFNGQGRILSVPPQLVRLLADQPGEDWRRPTLRPQANGGTLKQPTGQRNQA